MSFFLHLSLFLFASLALELVKQQVQPTLYSWNEIKLATRNFHPHNMLGEGAFGVVYKVSLSHFGVQTWVNWNPLYFCSIFEDLEYLASN